MNTHNWDKLYTESQTPWREMADLKDILQIVGKKDGTALDLGCGTGEWAIALNKQGFTVEGLDFSAEALKIAQSPSNEVRWVNWDLEMLADYPFKHPKYDLIIDRKVLAFIKNKEKYLDVVKTYLGGVYVLTVFHQHDERPDISLPQDLFDTLILPRFKVIRAKVLTPRPGKVVATYFLS